MVTSTSMATITDTETLNFTTTIHSITNVTLPDSPCGTILWNSSETVPGWPVLTMQPNSTAYLCQTYETPWHGNQTLYYLAYAGDVSQTWHPFIIVGMCKIVNQTTSCNDSEVSKAFQISVIPSTTEFYGNMSYYSVMYVMKALSNSTGFYNEGPPLTSCVSPFLAVGYSPAQINGSDFQLQELACPYTGPGPVAQYIMGFGVTYVNMTGHQEIP